MLLWVQPGAPRTAVAGEHDGCLRLRVAARPLQGRANEAIRTFLADALEVPRAAVTIEQGETSRRKRVRIAAPCSVAALRGLLETP